MASAPGTIICAEFKNGYGNTVKIDHGGGYVTLYAHLKSFNVQLNQKVERGCLLGIMGGTGGDYAEHIHFQLNYNGLCKRTIPESKPEPMSGYTNFEAGKSYFATPYEPITEPTNIIGLLEGGVYNPNLTPLFRNAYESYMGVAVDNGGGTAYVHQWNGVWIQDFRSSDARIWHLVHNPYQNQVWLLHGGFAEYWFGHFGEIGYPIDKEHLYTYVGSNPRCGNFGEKVATQPFSQQADCGNCTSLVWTERINVVYHEPVGTFNLAEHSLPEGGYCSIYLGPSSFLRLPDVPLVEEKYNWLCDVGSYVFYLFYSNGIYFNSLAHNVVEGNHQFWDPGPVDDNPPEDDPPDDDDDPTITLYAPVNVTCVDKGHDFVSLNWGSNGNSYDVYYKIYRSGNFIATSSYTNYCDNGVTAQTTYSYYVTAVNGGQESARSNTLTVTTMQAPQNDPTDEEPSEEPHLRVVIWDKHHPTSYGFEFDVTIVNSGTGVLEWSISADKSWVSFTKTNGTCTGTTASGTYVCVHTANLSAGEHSFNFTVSSNGGTNAHQITFVKEETEKPPDEDDPPEEEPVGNPVLKTNLGSYFEQTDYGQRVKLAVQNTGTGKLIWSLASSQEWISFGRQGDTTLAGKKSLVWVKIDQRGLSAGEHQALILINSNAGQKTETLTFNLQSDQDPGTGSDDPPEETIDFSIPPQGLTGSISFQDTILTLSGDFFKRHTRIELVSKKTTVPVKKYTVNDGWSLDFEQAQIPADFIYMCILYKLNNEWNWYWPGRNMCTLNLRGVEWVELSQGGRYLLTGKPPKEQDSDTTTITRVENPNSLSKSWQVEQNYPNPFNSSTMFNFILPQADQLEISIYDLQGRKITHIQTSLVIGNNWVSLDLHDLPSGNYLCLFQTKKFGQLKRVIALVK